MTHTFAICAYNDSPFLEECIRSVTNQTTEAKVILCTSTPSSFIRDLCCRYHVPMYVNEKEHGITQDWNFAYEQSDTDIVTIAHQDDVYDSHYSEELRKFLRKAVRPIIYFTDYSEIRDGQIEHDNKLLKIKRIMLFPLRFWIFWKSRFIRRRILSFGSPICCPSVSFVKKNCPDVVFSHGFRASEDWEAWEKLSRLPGSFVYNPKVLTFHRIHEESETSKILGDHARVREDYIMFRKFWPSRIAKWLVGFYSKSEDSNELK